MSAQHTPGVLVCWPKGGDGPPKLLDLPSYEQALCHTEGQAHRLMCERDEMLALLSECQPTLDHDARMARGTAAEGVRSMLAERVRAAIAKATGAVA